MATREELVKIFGESKVVKADRAGDHLEKISPRDAEALFEVGLPALVPGIFSVGLESGPKAFTILPLQAGGERLDLLVIGAPNSGIELRYCLDLEQGYLLLVDFDEDDPEVEVVNESLDNFVEFLFRIARLTLFKASADEWQREEYLDLLVAYLRERDSLAFSRSDGWWSMVFDRVL